jgi:hypothetical protein
MPIRFRCEYCGQLMGIARRKAGQLVDCPKCHHEIRVPESDQPERPKSDLLEHSQFERWLETPAGKAATARRAASGAAEQPSSDEPWSANEAPRRSFAGEHNDLLGFVQQRPVWTAAALVAAFILGVLVGRYLLPSRAKASVAHSAAPAASSLQVDAANETVAVKAAPSDEPLVQGSVVFQRDGKKRPDEGSSILVLPADQKPTEKIVSLGVRPEDHALKHQPGVDQIRRMGGAFGYVRADGQFSIPVARSATYFVLILSRHVDRPARQAIFPDELSILNQYFANVPELVRDREFLLVTRTPAPGRPASIDHVY